MTQLDPCVWWEVEDEIDRSDNTQEREKMTWRTRDGREIKIKDLTDTHLTNTLRYLDKSVAKGFPPGKYHPALTREALRRGLRWAPDREECCNFETEGGECSQPMTMFTVEIPQEPRCDLHRPDNHSWHKVPCSGCFEVKKLVLSIDKSGEVMFCEDCSSPGNEVYAWIMALSIT